MKNSPLPPLANDISIFTCSSGKDFTVRELLDELRRIRREFEWSVSDRQALQASLRSDEQRRLFDPVTAVTYTLIGEFYPCANSREAGRRLGLSFLDSANLAAASQYEWHPLSPLGSLRRALLDAIMDGATPTIH